MRSMLHKIRELCGFLLKNYSSMIITGKSSIKAVVQKKIEPVYFLRFKGKKCI